MSTGVTRWDCTFYRKLGLYVTGKPVSFWKGLDKRRDMAPCRGVAIKGDEKNMDKGRCPLCSGEEDIIHAYYWIILKLETGE
jgi:hypothetical protein